MKWYYLIEGAIMVLLWLEIVAGIGYFCYFFRWAFQIYASKKNKKSINPKSFWILTFIGQTLIAIYGFYLGSIIMPLTLPISWAIIWYNWKVGEKQ